MTDLDSPRRNNDCYFYYYSTCAKGDSCTFRHEPSALGCETMCSFWKEGKCLNIHCNFRHMELRKNRKAIQCYWETQPGGCLKPHCPFLHQNVQQNLANYGDNRIGQNTDISPTGKSNETLQASDNTNYRSSVDTLVVNFEEESDTESAPSPIKIKKANVKTLEEIKLEKIQEESAAYFSFSDSAPPPPSCDAEGDLRHRLLNKMKRKQLIEEDNTNVKRKKLEFLENASLDDHIRISSKKEINYMENQSLVNQISQKKRVKIGSAARRFEKEINTIKIKTLDEIRAERSKRQETEELSRKLYETNVEGSTCLTESENIVTSTSKDEIVSNLLNKMQPQLPQDSKSCTNDVLQTSFIFTESDRNIEPHKMAIDTECTEYVGNIDEPKGCSTDNELMLKEEQIINIQCEQNKPPVNKIENNKSNTFDSPMEQSETNSNGSDPYTNKLAEEVLLLDDDEDYANVNLKAEDELLDEIDDILGN